MKIPKWFGILIGLSFVVAIISYYLGTGKNFSTFLQYIDNIKLYNPFEQIMKDAKEYIDIFDDLQFNWSTNPFKLALNVLNYQFRLSYNLFRLVSLPVRFIYYIIVDLYYMLQAVYDFIR